MIAQRQIFVGAGSPPVLPYDAEVEYITIGAGQFCNLGIQPTVETVFKVRAAFMTGSLDLHFGFKVSEYENYRIFCYNTLYFDLGNYYAQGGRCTISDFPVKTVKDMEFGNNYIKVDGVEVVRKTTSTTTLVQSDFLLGGGGGSSNVYSAQLSTGGVIQRDMIPVRFTNELGQSEGAMYDRMSRRLFRNAGTGAFTIGPDKTSWTNPYVTDGLIAMWDGEWNAGGGVHDATRTSSMKDLVGSNDLSITLAPAVVSDKAVVFDGTQRAQCNVNFNVSNWLVNAGTAEIVAGYDSISDNADFDIGSTASNNRGLRPTSYATSPYTREIATCEYRFQTYRVIASPDEYVQGTPLVVSCVTNPQSQIASVYLDGAFFGNAQGGSLTTFQNVITIGTTAWTSTTTPSRPMHFFNFRLYSRALTAAEIAANYAIDKARFNLP